MCACIKFVKCSFAYMNFVQAALRFHASYRPVFSLTRRIRCCFCSTCRIRSITPLADPATGWVRALSPAALRSYLCAEPGAGFSMKFTPRAAFSSTVRCTSIWSRSITFSRAPSVM